MSKLTNIAALSLLAGLAACKTIPEPEPIPEPIIVEVPAPIQTCAPVSTLQMITIPAETKVQYAITLIDNPPYEPIESKTKRTIVVKPAQIFYADSEGREVLDICEKDIPIGPTGPGVGETIEEGG